MAIVADGLTKSFGDTRAVDGLGLRVPRGQPFGLVGPDGAGKTTILRLLASLLLPDAGSATVLGYDIRRQADAIKDHIGYMPQRFALYGDLTVEENLTFFASLYRVPSREWQERANRLLAFSGLQDFRARLADNLSGGMKQKLALACTLIHRPSLILLDEPTTGVDPISRREFWQILYGLLRDGITIVVSTPYMDEAERCQQVGFVSGGRILRSGTPAELKAGLSYHILELRGPGLSPLRRRLQQIPGVVDAQPFGDALHLAVEDPATTSARVKDALADAGVGQVEIHAVSPSMEDVFFHLVRNVTAGTRRSAQAPTPPAESPREASSPGDQ